LATGVFFSSTCNFLGIVGLLAYFTGLGPEKGKIVRLNGDIMQNDESDY
jgi:hypothetical protein